MKNMKGQADYVTVRISRGLADEIGKVVKHATVGYRTRAELVNDAIRLKIELLSFTNLMKPNV